MPYDAFISYRHADGDAARGVTKLLRAFALTVFIDEGVAAGSEWAPEIWDALAASRTLMVLWSRSAAKSPFVHAEWTRAPQGCRIIPLMLDGEALPPALGKVNAITGLDVAGRLIARSVELMRARKLSPAKAQEQLLRELAADGVVLEEKQKRALAEFLPLLVVSSWWLSSSAASWGLGGAGAATAFGVGLWVAHSTVTVPPTSPQVTLNSSTPVDAAPIPAAVCPAASPCPDSERAPPAPSANPEAAALNESQAKLAACVQQLRAAGSQPSASAAPAKTLGPSSRKYIPPDETQPAVNKIAPPGTALVIRPPLKLAPLTAAGGGATIN
jgi:hypothetical protein